MNQRSCFTDLRQLFQIGDNKVFAVIICVYFDTFY